MVMRNLARQRNDFVGCKEQCRHEEAYPENAGSPLKRAENYARSHLGDIFVGKTDAVVCMCVFSPDTKFIIPTPVLKFSDINWVLNTSIYL